MSGHQIACADSDIHPLLRSPDALPGSDGILFAIAAPALVLDVYGYILGGNARGLELIDRHPAFFVERGYLALRRRTEAWGLADALLEACRGSTEAVNLTLLSRTGRPVLLIRLVGVGRKDVETVMCTIEDLLDQVEDTTRLASALGVTPSQAHAAACLAHGMTVAEIAVLMNVQQSTVRTHIHDAMQRLGLTGQRELAICTLRMARFLGLMQTPMPENARNKAANSDQSPSGDN